MERWDPKKLEIRLMKQADLDAVTDIDESVFGRRRLEYYESKIKSALDPERTLVTSLVAEYEGVVVGFLMGELYQGEFGIPESSAMADTIGVRPSFQHRGIANRLMDDFLSILKGARVERVYTIVSWNDRPLLGFFEKSGFAPGGSLVLERKMP